MANPSDRFKGKRCVSLGFSRPGNTAFPATVILEIQDETMALTERLKMSAKEFTDVMSGLATWVDDFFADHRKAELDAVTKLRISDAIDAEFDNERRAPVTTIVGFLQELPIDIADTITATQLAEVLSDYLGS